MRLLPRSLYGRLLMLSALATLVALAVAGVAIGGVLERFVTSTLDDRLADKLGALSSAVRKDGSLDEAYLVRFDTHARDADWRVEAPGGVAGSAMTDAGLGIGDGRAARLGPITNYQRHARPPEPPRIANDGRPAPPDAGVLPPGPPELADPHEMNAQPFDTTLRDGTRVHGRWQSLPTDRGDARAAVALPRDLIDRPLREAVVPLALSLLALGAALALAAVVQLRLGLRPLRALRDQVAAIRAGRAETLPAGQPAELAPLAEELNSLAADNRAALTAARGSAANLAHGLKTPVATLGLALAEPGRDPDGSLAAQVARIDAVIRHHLARARSALTGARASTPVAAALADLADTVRRLHAGRGVTIAVTAPDDLAVAVDPNDFAELAGNLIDNAARHATQRVTVAAATRGRMAEITVADDGPGIPPAIRASALAPGARLDEAGDGHGFGLAITAELTALHGGALTLDDAGGGGLIATVTLPLAAG